jgi:hypothetical protein
MGERRRVRDVLLTAAKDAIRRFVELPTPEFAPGDVCRVNRSLVADTGGTLLRGSVVRVTGVQDPKGRFQVRVVDIPEYQWTETSRLPYGPDFVLFVEGEVLEKAE